MINKNKSKAQLKIDAIYEVLISLPQTNHTGIFGGELGMALFLIYYAKLRDNNDALTRAFQVIGRIGQTINLLENKSPILSAGITGFGWLVSHIEKHRLYQTGSVKLLNNIDKIVIEQAFDLLDKGDYDYLHGALGVGNYLLNRNRTRKNIESLKVFVAKLKSLAIIEGEYVKWNDFDLEQKKTKEGEYNWGLSHGAPSILMFLVNCYEANIEPLTIMPLIKGTVNFMLTIRQDPFLVGSCFPYKTTDNVSRPEKSRLGWCYGDLGAIYVLSRANQIIKLTEVDAYISEVSEFEASRKDLMENEIADAGFCHGASGVAHLFNKLYKLTKNENYEASAKYWYDVTLKMDIYHDGLAGYKSYRSVPKPALINDPSLIEGVTGVGLSLISYVTDMKYKWDEIFLVR